MSKDNGSGPEIFRKTKKAVGPETRFVVVLPTNLYRAIRQIARDNETSLKEVVKDAFRHYIDKYEADRGKLKYEKYSPKIKAVKANKESIT